MAKNQNDLGKGIATAGIWLGVGFSAIYCGFFTVFIALVAAGATGDIWQK